MMMRLTWMDTELLGVEQAACALGANSTVVPLPVPTSTVIMQAVADQCQKAAQARGLLA